jgi:protein-tyrosine phosphatase
MNRIPIPEGLSPESPASLDASLIRLIESYTLQGISILVHCRGGVGRAGIIACCWLLKLGLCGWIDTQISSTSTNETISESPLGLLRRDTTQLVERIITVVRRRRSAKAIETFEQVLFLVEFVEYLRNRGSDVSSCSVSSVTNLLGREDLGSG